MPEYVGWMRVPRALVTSGMLADMSGAEAKVVIAICNMGEPGEVVHPGYAKLMRETGLSRGSVCKALANLSKRGITPVESQGKFGSRDASSYIIAKADDWSKNWTSPKSELVQKVDRRLVQKLDIVETETYTTPPRARQSNQNGAAISDAEYPSWIINTVTDELIPDAARRLGIDAELLAEYVDATVRQCEDRKHMRRYYTMRNFMLFFEELLKHDRPLICAVMRKQIADIRDIARIWQPMRQVIADLRSGKVHGSEVRRPNAPREPSMGLPELMTQQQRIIR